MVTLRAMRSDEFAAYSAYFVVDYAAEIAANYGYSAEKSHTIATHELAVDLPQGLHTAGNELLCIEAENGVRIGYLWFRPNGDNTSIFILDFMIAAEMRGQGYGKAAMTALEQRLVPTGLEQIKLRVAFENKAALRLYEKQGYRITGYNMIKHLIES